MAEAKENAGGEVDDKEVKVPSDVLVIVMANPYTAITEVATKSTAISGGALDDTITQSRWAVVRAVTATDTAQDARREGAQQHDRVRESAAGKLKRIVLH